MPRITKKETKTRAGYVLLGLFAFMIVEPVREYIVETLNWNGMTGLIIGVIGFFVVLYYFDF